MTNIKEIFAGYRPKPTHPAYPPYHTGDYLEDYFFNYYYNSNINTKRIFIPVSWTTCYIENKQRNLQNTLDSLDQNKIYFTVSQHDDAIMERLPPNTLKFCAGGNMGGIPIPLVCSSIPSIDIETHTSATRDLLCSFHGSITHKIRHKLVMDFRNKSDVIVNGYDWSLYVNNKKYCDYLKTALRSRFLLCPRGYGLNSFRLYESFQLGCVPVVITNERFLPWEDVLDWNTFCVIVSDSWDLYKKLQNISDTEYNQMLITGQNLYSNYFTLLGVCQQILKRIDANIEVSLDK